VSTDTKRNDGTENAGVENACVGKFNVQHNSKLGLGGRNN